MKRWSITLAAAFLAFAFACNEPAYRASEEHQQKDLIDKGSTIVDNDDARGTPGTSEKADPTSILGSERDMKIEQRREMEARADREYRLEKLKDNRIKPGAGPETESAWDKWKAKQKTEPEKTASDEEKTKAKKALERGDALVKKDDYKTAEAAYRESRKLWHANPDLAPRARALYADGELLFKEKKYSEASMRYKLVLTLAPDDSFRARDRLYECMIAAMGTSGNEKKPDDNTETPSVKNVTEEKPADPVEDTGDDKKQVLEKTRQKVKELFEKGEESFKKGEFSEALKSFEKVIELMKWSGLGTWF
jgi:tetratricopeptide (TPR) repeat protein